MSLISQESIVRALKSVIDSDSGKNVIDAGMISGINVEGGKVRFVITIQAFDKERKAHLAKACEAAAAGLPGVTSAVAIMTAETAPSDPAARKPAVWNKEPIPGVKKIIAVASGKGGVGKSTVAVNLALALHAMGERIGLLDADIYGPSIPRMMGLEGRPEIQEGKMIPLKNHGVQCMSMGFITGDQAAIMRGPMISKTLNQLLRATFWNQLDALLIDMPPGTGDIHLSLAQQAPLAGAVIVTTPQQVAISDARKCAIMFQKIGVPILGVVENMSGGVFGQGGGALFAQDMEAPFLGEIGLDAEICQASDNGQAYKGKYAEAYAKIAQKLIA